MAKWWRENRDRHKENVRRHDLRKIQAEGFHTESQLQELTDICDNKCLCCGGSEDLTRDHIVALANGGSDWITNIQILCRSCNCSKQDLHSTDYRSDYIKQWAEAQRKELENGSL